MRPRSGPPESWDRFWDPGDPRRGWEFVSTGHGDVPWEDAFRALDATGYTGPISIEWQDAGMDRLHGAAQAVKFVRSLLWACPEASFDAAFRNR
jgi:sugar phosphate isomerase/epimerase